MDTVVVTLVMTVVDSIVYEPLSMVLAGAELMEAFWAAAANISTVMLERGLTTPTMPAWQCLRAEQ